MHRSLIIVLFCTAWLTGCSSIKIAYNYAPNYLSYRLNSYVNLDAQQQQLLDAELIDFSNWHSSTALPQYASTMQVWSARLDKAEPFTPEEVVGMYQQVQEALFALSIQAAKQLAPIAVSLKPTQIAKLRARFETENKEYADNYLKNSGSSSTRKKHHSRMLKRYEDWLGSLTEKQKLSLTQLADRRAASFALWANERQLRQTALLDTLNAQRNKEPTQAETALTLYTRSLAEYRDPTLISLQEALRKDWAETTAALLNSMTPTQNRYLKTKLREYSEDFASLTPMRVAQQK
jgi:Family of unknown function (DUF6279)